MRRADAPRLNRLKIRHPGLSIVRRSVGGPRKAIRLNVVVADPPSRRHGRADAELLLDPHLIAFAMPGAEVLQTRCAVRGHKLPLILASVVGAQGPRHVVRAVTGDGPVLVENRSAVTHPHSAPKAAELSVLLAVGGEFPVAQE